ncbi:MAG: FHA domain-containing protein [Solirubrobacterales bacterium]|nr:FHA domain-containing protein [Solirubrobacterales bacterium]
MTALTLEIVEGPGAGRQLSVDRPVLIGREAHAQLSLEDTQASRRHARVSPARDGSLVVEDLGSANGTFVNHNQVQGRARLDPGDELLLGVTVIQVRSDAEVAAQPSAVRPVPAGLAVAASAPAYVDPALVAGVVDQPLSPELERYRDVRVRQRARLAPLALLILVALTLSIYFATH